MARSTMDAPARSRGGYFAGRFESQGVSPTGCVRRDSLFRRQSYVRPVAVARDGSRFFVASSQEPADERTDAFCRRQKADAVTEVVPPSSFLIFRFRRPSRGIDRHRGHVNHPRVFFIMA